MFERLATLLLQFVCKEICIIIKLINKNKERKNKYVLNSIK